jgi:hypothetical protein
VDFEWREIAPGRDGGAPSTEGLLVECFQGGTLAEDFPEDLATRCRVLAAWYTTGRVHGPREDARGEYAGCDFRYDGIFGARYIGLEEEDDDTTASFLSDEVDRANAVELALGIRAEWSPARGVVLFGRVDAGLMPLLVVNEASGHALAGVRLEPVRGVGVEAGWRLVWASTADVFRSSVSLSWNGPWAGLVFTF